MGTGCPAVARDDLTPAGSPPVVPADEYGVLDDRAAGGQALRGGMLRTLGFAGGLLLSLASAPLVVRHLGDAEFGRYSSVLAIIAIVTGVTEGGVNTIALRELAAAPHRRARDELMRDLLGLRLALSVAGVMIACAFSVIAGYDGDLVLGTLLAGVAMVATVTQTLLAAVLQSQLRFGLAAAIDFGRQAMTTALLIVLVVLDAGVVFFLGVLVPLAAGSLLVTVLLVRSATVIRPSFSPSRWRGLVRETVVFAVAVAVNSLYFRLTLVIMSLIATATETGHFAISYRVMEVLIGVPAMLIGAAFPIISRAVTADRERFDTASCRLFELGLLAGTVVALILTLGAPFVIEILTGDMHNPATDVLRIQSVAIIASFVAAATGFPLLGLHRNRETLMANLLSVVVVVVLALALVPGLGAQGGALAAVAADFTLALVNTAMLMRRGGPPLPLRTIPVALVAGGVAYAVAHLVAGDAILRMTVGAVVYLGLLLAIGRFPPEVREILSWRRMRAGFPDHR